MSETDLHLGAAVYSRDGKHVGKLASVIVRQADEQEEEVVLQESTFFSGHLLRPGTLLLIDELIVPRSAIQSATRDRIELSLDSKQVRRLPPYLTYHYSQPTGAQELEETMATTTASAGMAAIAEEAHKPRGDIEIAAGENVMIGRTGKRLGRVTDVLIDHDELVGVVIERGVFDHEFVLPVRFLDRSDDMALFTHLIEDDLQRLKPFEPAE